MADSLSAKCTYREWNKFSKFVSVSWSWEQNYRSDSLRMETRLEWFSFLKNCYDKKYLKNKITKPDFFLIMYLINIKKNKRLNSGYMNLLPICCIYVTEYLSSPQLHKILLWAERTHHVCKDENFLLVSLNS